MSINVLPGGDTCDVLFSASRKVYHVTAELDAGFLYSVKLPLGY